MSTPAAVTEVTPNMVMVIFTSSTFLKFQPASAAALDIPMTPNVQYSEGLAAVTAVEGLVLVVSHSFLSRWINICRIHSKIYDIHSPVGYTTT